MSTPASGRPSYAAVLRVPYARRTFAAALVGRLSYGTVSIAVMLSVTRATGSYAVAGTVMALFGATTVLLSPPRAAFVDRYGPGRALKPMALIYGALLAALSVASWRPGAPAPPTVCSRPPYRRPGTSAQALRPPARRSRGDGAAVGAD
ncbi:hypothetical protein ACWDAZ_26165, partial [Streptomyces sp. NPDC001215]